MSREFADWFFDNKKAGCGNVWFMMMAAMWEGWQGRAAMLLGAEPVRNRDELPGSWVACSEQMPEGMTDVHISNGHDVGQGWWDGDTWQTQHDYYSVPGDVTHWMPLPAAPQQEA
ncbi:DUF551 domain-containing protein [Enterobacter sp. DNB-S2]|uniref:DUF551 domain-containing protein n=1 Tax=Enterobacter sp. DNB-S2 TaxID=2720029 RepID=UPI001C626B7E|nr:DUF551 domain-containing protein [Enterobacter sp. DNB-S2]QYH18066.1 DUF551 domain-containing protein [Enterobacter sp. DNB-S2]